MGREAGLEISIARIYELILEESGMRDIYTTSIRTGDPSCSAPSQVRGRVTRG
jgi:hypothetical protein